VWGDADVHDLTPMRTKHIERLVLTDPQKTFLRKKMKVIFANITNEYRKHFGLDEEKENEKKSCMLRNRTWSRLHTSK